MAGIEIVFVSPNNAFILCSFSLTMECSTNTNEAVINGLEIALGVPIANLIIYGDSKLIAKQLLKEYNVRKVKLIHYHSRAEKLLTHFEEVKKSPHPANCKSEKKVGLTTSVSVMERETPQHCGDWKEIACSSSRSVSRVRENLYTEIDMESIKD